jgi:ankyrin repeat protein
LTVSTAGARCSRDKYGSTPLHDAAENGNTKCIKILLEYGCNPLVKDATGQTAADVALINEHAKCAETLKGAEKKWIRKHEFRYSRI